MFFKGTRILGLANLTESNYLLQNGIKAGGSQLLRIRKGLWETFESCLKIIGGRRNYYTSIKKYQDLKLTSFGSIPFEHLVMAPIYQF